MPDELLLEVFSDVDELPTEVDAALDAEDVLSASAGTAAMNMAVAVARATNDVCRLQGVDMVVAKNVESIAAPATLSRQ